MNKQQHIAITKRAWGPAAATVTAAAGSGAVQITKAVVASLALAAAGIGAAVGFVAQRATAPTATDIGNSRARMTTAMTAQAADKVKSRFANQYEQALRQQRKEAPRSMRMT